MTATAEISVPESLRYTSTHEWLRKEANGEWVMGVTTYAQQQLGDIVFVELPDVGRVFKQGDDVAVLESVKTAADLFVPAACQIVAVNEGLADQPEQVNQDPYSKGWLIRVAVVDEAVVQALLTAEDYQQLIGD